jgi:phosphoribosyl 1,2-cyclic phosphodiesterase
VNLSDVDAILITHEHHDHIQGLKTIITRYNIPIFANADTAKAILETGIRPKFKIFSTGETFEYADIEVDPFSIQHDTLDPVAFTFKSDGMKIGVCTDLGFVTTLVASKLEKCDVLYIEANHEPSMVYACNRPSIYKERVLSRQGHLSNAQTADLLSSIAHPNLQLIYLAHLSQECNSPELALKIATANAPGIPIEIALQNSISKVFNCA